MPKKQTQNKLQQFHSDIASGDTNRIDDSELTIAYTLIFID